MCVCNLAIRCTTSQSFSELDYHELLLKNEKTEGVEKHEKRNKDEKNRSYKHPEEELD